MKAALLCPGPSLGRWPDDTWAEYPIRVAVNRAVLRAPVTDWVFADLAPFTVSRAMLPLPLPRLWTASVVAAHISAYGPTCYDVINDRFPFLVNTYKPDGVVDWRSYSATAALVVAASLGAKSIDVFGADWTPEPDWDGQMINEAPEIERAPSRWENEKQIWDAVVYDLKNRFGISITRLKPE